MSDEQQVEKSETEHAPDSYRILVVDDDDAFRDSLQAVLQQACYQVEAIDSPQAALEFVANQSFDIVISDFKMPDMNGIEFIREGLKRTPESAMVLMTAYGNFELAVQALREGAYDYIPKPFQNDEILLTLRKVCERLRLKREVAALQNAINRRYHFGNIVAQSKQMKDIFDTVKRLTSFNTTVLITGESGTGKELLARAVHHNSPRRGAPFVAINCGAIPENLIESELFGHKQGSFTDASHDRQGLFEEANGGTIFLDEIAELPMHLQVKLLRVLQERQIRPVGAEELIDIDVRVIAATHRDLEERVHSGTFRDDLYFRLNVVSIELPPLRERPEDIPILVEHFMQKHNRRLGIDVSDIDTDTARLLMSYPWPGNVRELENCVERAMVLTESGKIDLNSLPSKLQAFSSEDSEDQGQEDLAVDEENLSIKQHTRALEVRLIKQALRCTNGNRTHAAKVLEVSHRTLLYKLKEYEIT